MKTLKLLYPEWQGFGENNRAGRGALAVYKAFPGSNDFIKIDVPREEDLKMEGSILGRSSIIRNTERALDRVNDKRPDRVFMIGGTCASEMIPISYLNSRYRGDLAVVWFDAHPDLNTPQSSPSGHFHGMVLRALLGDGDQILSEFVLRPLAPSQVTLAGVRDIDEPEAEYASAERIPIISSEDLKTSDGLTRAMARSESSNLYVHIDLDFFNPNDFEGAQFQAPGGISMDELAPVLAELNSCFTIVGLGVVEFVSDDPEKAATIPALFEKSEIAWACT
jgi:arginase